MTQPTSEQWPVAELDPVRRLRILSAAVPGSVLVERIIPAPFETVWAVAADLEQELPRYQPHVRAFRITRIEGDRLQGLASGYAGLRARFDAVLRPGWCWMQSRFLLFGVAAVPVPGGTLLARAGGSRVPGAALLQPLRARGLARELDRLQQRVLHR
jgi:hypothetical protein